MKEIQKIPVFDKFIYINPTIGCFSFAKSSGQMQGYIDYEEVMNQFKPKFINICLCICNNCNLNCDYCFNEKKNQKIMTSDQADKIIDEMINRFPDCDKYYVDLSGNGEPLLNLKCILEINSFCKERSNLIRKEILVSFVSNGVLLTNKMAELLQKEGILFGISLDGNKHNHDLHRKTINGSPTYDLIMKNIKSIKFRDYIGCAITITNDVFNLVETIDDLSKYFNTISIKPVRDAELGLTRKSVNKWLNQYELLTLKIINDSKSGNWDTLKILINGDDYFGKFIYRAFLESRTLNRCDSRISRFCFDCYGHIYGCAPATKYNQLSIEKIDYQKAFRKQIENTKASCNNCLFYLFCGGECEIETIINKKINSDMCLFKQGLIKFAMYIKLFIEGNDIYLFNDIKNFCTEKANRFSKDEELYSFLNSHQDLNFTDGKNEYDQLNKKY